MKGVVNVLKKSLEFQKTQAEARRDNWLAERRRYLLKKEDFMAVVCKMLAEVHQDYAREYRDIIKGG